MTTKELLYAILDVTTKEKYPDIHLNTWFQPIVRNHTWDLIKIETLEIAGVCIEAPELTKELIKNIIIELSGYIWIEKFTQNFELDTSYQYLDKDRYRINCYMDSNGYSIAMRMIPNNIPTMEELNLWESIKEMCNKNKWLILVTGPTGSGKSTNLAAMIDYLNKTVKKHIITIEDPVEFAFKSDKCLINQRELWSHTKWFSEAIKSALREDPDIIMVWEMRDSETIKAALTLAETGHLVLSTLHTNDSVQSIDRIVDVFPTWQQDQIRMQFAMSLVWIISQKLLPRSDKEWRIAAREILIGNDAIRNLIITGKTHQIYSVIEVSSKYGMILMDKYLIFLYKKWIISKETLFSYARDKEWIEMLISE